MLCPLYGHSRTVEEIEKIFCNFRLRSFKNIWEVEKKHFKKVRIFEQFHKASRLKIHVIYQTYSLEEALAKHYDLFLKDIHKSGINNGNLRIEGKDFHYHFEKSKNKKIAGGGSDKKIIVVLPAELQGSISEHIIKVHELSHYFERIQTNSLLPQSMPANSYFATTTPHLFFTEYAAMIIEWSFLTNIPIEIRSRELMKVKKLAENDIIDENALKFLSLFLTDNSPNASSYILNQKTTYPKRGYRLDYLKTLEVRNFLIEYETFFKDWIKFNFERYLEPGESIDEIIQFYINNSDFGS